MYATVVNDCTNLAIENKACQIINEYIEFWPNSGKFEDYKIEQLDLKFYYLIYAHNNKFIDIFNYNNSIYTTLFLIL